MKINSHLIAKQAHKRPLWMFDVWNIKQSLTWCGSVFIIIMKWRYQRWGGSVRVENQGGSKWGGGKEEEEKTWIMEFSHNIYLENTWRVVDIHNCVTTMFMKVYILSNLRWLKQKIRERMLAHKKTHCMRCCLLRYFSLACQLCMSIFCVIWAQVATL